MNKPTLKKKKKGSCAFPMKATFGYTCLNNGKSCKIIHVILNICVVSEVI